MEKINLSATINLQRMDKKGRHQVRIRSTIKRKVVYYPTGINVLPGQFENGEVVRHPTKNALNLTLRNRIHQIERDYVEGKLKPRSRVNFHDYAAGKITQQKKRDSLGTWKHKKSYLSKIRKFRALLFFEDITPPFMLDFENYCRGLGNKPTTVWSNIKFLKSMVNAALHDGVIAVNPMRGYKGSAYVNPEREFLNDAEILAVEAFAVSSENPTLVKVANWFLFGCFSGLRYADVKNFTRSKIQGDRIILRTGKAKTDVSIHLHPKLAAVVSVMDPSVMANQKINDYLKIIAAACGIKKRLTFHVSRHTHAVYFLNHGGSMDTLSKLLGHTSTRTTAIYGKITNVRIDSEVSKVWG
jgi:integrase